MKHDPIGDEVRFVMLLILTIILAFGVLVLYLKPAGAHSWYPMECCHDKDCQQIPSKEVKVLPQGGYQWHEFVIPQRKVRFAPDNNYHICIFNGHVLCFFAPQPST